MQDLWGDDSLLFQVFTMFYTLVTEPTAALAAEEKFFSLFFFRIQFGP